MVVVVGGDADVVDVVCSSDDFVSLITRGVLVNGVGDVCFVVDESVVDSKNK